MNCVRCNYLLWDLSENRCPECGLAFEVTDYDFPKKAVAFVCRACDQSYAGNDEHGLPAPRRFICTKCNAPLDVAQLRVRPLRDDAVGEPLRLGTPWEQRHRVGFVRAYLDGVARLAMQPQEYFRLSASNHNHGEIVFSVLCAYLAGAVLIGAIMLLQYGGLLTWIPDIRLLLNSRSTFMLIALVPLVQIVWNYFYGLLIQGVLAILGQQGSDYESSVRAVAFGSAVLPAVFLLPPVGVLWYIRVVSSGVEHLHHTSRGQALIATMIPMLLAGNVVLIAGYAVFAS
ncbi:MAG: YIP1 family protein [Planctomycetes bacterium]|nr:YIP1 family protein [Planctomycetota bacterium]